MITIKLLSTESIAFAMLTTTAVARENLAVRRLAAAICAQVPLRVR